MIKPKAEREQEFKVITKGHNLELTKEKSINNQKKIF